MDTLDSQRVRGLELEFAVLKNKFDTLEKQNNNLQSGINRGLWILGGGFIAALVAWVVSGGLLR